ncbi:lipase family protein [Botrimarina mediterranea]|uniref:Lipase (Class 3) n=1 Tax=Botrimarina mediterranea TaxID=2528022 RepID=A0A518K786_9BACT|nr:lipase family protein [Botrimarina mediterranea]QDV73637.1 Lipase (class 3) [Botrimarina mediterranea]
MSGLLPSAEHLTTEWDTLCDTVPWATAITLAEMSTLAYSTPHNRELVLRLLGFDRIRLLDDGPRSGLVAMAEDAAIVAFRGTDDLEDWFANFDFREQTQLSDGRTVHRGFQAYYNVFADEVKRVLADWAPNRLWVTGHSLGGAMAACCAVDLVDSDIPFSGIVTFGQPRIGNDVLARRLDFATSGRYMRFVNEDDAVPLAPPGLLWNYWHCGSRIRFRDEQLDRRQGLAVFSCSAPAGEDAPEGELQPVSPDGEDSLSEEELREIKGYLKVRKQSGLDEERPTEVEGTADGSAGQPMACSAAAPGLVDRVVHFLEKRINDHSMTEYLRRLNEFSAE